MLGAKGISSTQPTPSPTATHLGAKVRKSPEARIKEMAKEFESTFLSMLLKEMRQTLDEDGGFFPGDKGDVQGGLFDSFMSQHLAASGGVGMAAALERQLQPKLRQHETHTHGIDPALPPGGHLA